MTRPHLAQPLRLHAPPLIAPILLLTVVALLGSLGNEALQYRDLTMINYVVIVVALYIFVGNSGILSFGHAAIISIGAYTFGILRTDPLLKEQLLPGLPHFLAASQLAPLPATLAAGAAAAVFGALVAVPLMRVNGLIAALASFALLLVVNSVISNWTNLTHGTGGLDINQTTTRNVALAWAAIAIVVAYLLQSSTRGLRLRAAREEEVAARAIGVLVARERGVAFVVSCFFLGVGGALIAGQLGSFTPGAFYLSITFLTVAMLVVGGITSLAGAVIGTIVLSVLSEGLRQAEATTSVSNLQEIGFAAVMLAILLLRPAGITSGREFRLPSPRHSRVQLPEPTSLPTAADASGPTAEPGASIHLSR